MISNCMSAGADSRADPVTGVVTRKDKTTGMVEPAVVRPNGVPEDTKAEAPLRVDSVSPSVMAAILGTG